jgi:sec-independent protein translocase protein TatC
MRKYFFEIKNRVCLILLLFGSLLITFYMYKELLLFFIISTTQIYNKGSSEYFYYYFIFTEVTEIFYAYLKLIFFLSFQFVCLYAVYQVFLFFSSAFFEIEYFYIKRIVVFSAIAWFFSSVFVYYYIIPVTWDFFLGFQFLSVNYSSSLYFEAKISDYVAFYLNTYFYCFIYSQSLVFIVIFFNKHQKSVVLIKKYRKIHIYSFIIFSTIVSPPDILSQTTVGFVFIFLYELTIFFLTVKTLICKA